MDTAMTEILNFRLLMMLRMIDEIDRYNFYSIKRILIVS